MQRKNIGNAVAYMKVNLNDGTVISFGGGKTTSVTGAVEPTPGNVHLTLTGKYPGGITADKVILSATCESGAYCVSNARVSSATPTKIDIYLAGFVSNTASDIGNNAYLIVYIGQ